MATKSRYQLIDRGRKGRPAWYMTNSVTDSNQFVGRTRGIADGVLSCARRLEPEERRREALVAEGYHLPGLPDSES